MNKTLPLNNMLSLSFTLIKPYYVIRIANIALYKSLQASKMQPFGIYRTMVFHNRKYDVLNCYLQTHQQNIKFPHIIHANISEPIQVLQFTNFVYIYNYIEESTL